jgi:hypothetical protein
MNKKLLPIRLALAATLWGFVLVAVPAIAQTDTTSPLPTPQSSVDTTRPLPGSNSFTENQVRERLQENGFNSVTGLRKDDNGIWRGQAMRNGVKGPVSIDYRGNIFQQ